MFCFFFILSVLCAYTNATSNCQYTPPVMMFAFIILSISFLKEISPGAFWPTPIWSSYLCTGYTALVLELLFNIILGTCFTSRLFISCSLHIMSPSFFICSLILLHWNGYVGGKLFLRLDISEKIFILFEYLINNLMGYGILSCN